MFSQFWAARELSREARSRRGPHRVNPVCGNMKLMRSSLRLCWEITGSDPNQAAHSLSPPGCWAQRSLDFGRTGPLVGLLYHTLGEGTICRLLCKPFLLADRNTAMLPKNIKWQDYWRDLIDKLCCQDKMWTSLWTRQRFTVGNYMESLMELTNRAEVEQFMKMTLLFQT